MQGMKNILKDMIPKEQARIKKFRAEHGQDSLGAVTVDMVRLLCWLRVFTVATALSTALSTATRL